MNQRDIIIPKVGEIFTDYDGEHIVTRVKILPEQNQIQIDTESLFEYKLKHGLIDNKTAYDVIDELCQHLNLDTNDFINYISKFQRMKERQNEKHN